MRSRRRMGRKKSRKLFSRTASAHAVHPKNVFSGPMRGGIRL